METTEETIRSGSTRTQPTVCWMIPLPPDFHRAYRIVSAWVIMIEAPLEMGHRTIRLDTTNTSASLATAASPTTAAIMGHRTITIMNCSAQVGWTSLSSIWHTTYPRIPTFWLG